MKKKKNFNGHFDVKKTTEHVNILLGSDLELFIDPFNIANNLENKIAKKVYFRSRSFLEKLNRTYIVPNDRLNGLNFLSHLQEANEYGFGYSKTNKGKGIGLTKAEVIFDSLSSNLFAREGISITNEAHNVLLLVKGIGPDNMSDTLANVCRDIFAEFTYEQCLLHGIATSKVEIEYYDSNRNCWMLKDAHLPSFLGKTIILVPKFLIGSKRAYTSAFNWFISSNYLSKEILNGNLKSDNSKGFINRLKNGTKRVIIKNINKHFKKPKGELVEFVKKYNGSLLEFQMHIKNNFPHITEDQLLLMLS
ncbi:hypothetical protein GKZ90_0013980 [Flavobacterium sp. MC2016-06]|jgi:hypothetical protein|uniref:hypothetical protein n=1 Tax=Flavobacterium sp. MC2016-06 TaxID=2676308 RepID=UPI0012BB16FB|nr:hypothetical protein [Flavobacterium sp. MC2016-06]MBU3861723.1 hypothetical protein [Flavobacterium sp. MC2016-06]